MRLKSLVVSVAALLALAAPASAGAKTLIGSGSVAAQPVLQALFAKYHKLHRNVSFVYTANGGNAGVKDVQNGKSQFAGQARTAAAQRCRDDLHQDVPRRALHRRQQGQPPAEHLDQQAAGHLHRADHQLERQSRGSNLSTTIDPVGRDTNGGTYNFFLQAVLNNQLPSGNVNALTADGLVINAVKQDANAIGYAGLAWQGSKKLHAVKVNGVHLHARVRSRS